MPKFTVTLIEILTHRVMVEAATESAAVHAAEIFLTETDHYDEYIFVASGYQATNTEAAPVDAQPNVKDEAIHADLPRPAPSDRTVMPSLPHVTPYASALAMMPSPSNCASRPFLPRMTCEENQS